MKVHETRIGMTTTGANRSAPLAYGYSV